MHIKKNCRLSIQIAMLAILVVYALFVWEGATGFSLWDEGFLWYGVQRVMLGEVPIRDFMAYDPGRYYWSAALMSLWGANGIMALRISIAVFQVAGLFSGLLIIAKIKSRRSAADIWFLLVSAIILATWMFPRHKLFDISLSLLLIVVLTEFIRSPTSWRYFFSGIFIGVVALFGRNHGVYGAIAAITAMGWLRIRSDTGIPFIKGLILWAVGVAIGFSPMLLMALLIPGFGAAFWESIRFLFELKGTNLSLPIPWPWLPLQADVPLPDAMSSILLGMFFVGILVFGSLSVVWVISRRLKSKYVSPELVAAACLAIPYAHYAFSRADIDHLAQGIFPCLVGFLLLASDRSGKVKWSLIVLLAGSSCWVTYTSHPGWQCRPSADCTYVEISGSHLRVNRETEEDIALLRGLASKYAPDGQLFMAAPFWPGAYALLERRSPVWEIYPLFHRSADFEQAEISRLRVANPAFIIIVDSPLDGSDELRFRNTHPLMQEYISNNFDLLPDSLHPSYLVYKSRKSQK